MAKVILLILVNKYPKKKKTSLVNNLFGEVSDKYDLMNDLMSLGIHRLMERTISRLDGS